jgi:CheY-like chemotaxis protein
MNLSKNILVLAAEDDADDRLLIQKAFKKASITGDLLCVEDGIELMKYLQRQTPYTDAEKFPMPKIILLDLNMPKKDGREALREIKSDKTLCMIPVIVFTTSHAHEDIVRSYKMGVNSYITKPSRFDDLIVIAKAIESYWFRTVKLPV